MARPIKEGLEYCSLDTNIFSDRKIRRLLKTFGAKGYTIFSCLLCEIFKDKGYYMQYDDELAFDISDNIPGTTEQLVKDVIDFCFECDLFNKAIFTSMGTLTSAGIQKRYRKAKEGSKVVIVQGIWINEQETGVIDRETPVKPPVSTQRKEKKRKESKVEELLPPLFGDMTIKNIIDLLNDCIASQSFREYICMNMKIDDKSTMEYLAAFNLHLSSLGVTMRAVKEYRGHFQNWLRKRLADQKKGIKTETPSPYKKADATKYQ